MSSLKTNETEHSKNLFEQRIYEDTFSEAERLINLFSGSGYLVQQGVIPSSFILMLRNSIPRCSRLNLMQALASGKSLRPWNFTVLETSSRPKKPSAEEIEQRMSEIKRKRIAEMEAKIDESTPKGSTYAVIDCVPDRR